MCARAGMKITTVMLGTVTVLAVFLVPQVTSRSPVVDQVSSALQESFSSLSSKRTEWFENYSSMNNLTKTTNERLNKLNFLSNAMLPLVWYLYKNSVMQQKEYYPKVVEASQPALPFHTTTNLMGAKLGLNFYLEATLILTNFRDFQVRISKDGEAVFYLKLYFNERRAVMGYVHDQEEVEKVVLEGDQFPSIPLYKKFRVNVQVMTDCMVASFWLDNLDLIQMSPLPEKYIWCSRDYSYGETVAFDISLLDDGQQETDDIFTFGGDSVPEVKLLSVDVYNGMIYQ